MHHKPLSIVASLRGMLVLTVLIALSVVPRSRASAEEIPADRFVWVFGWSLRSDAEVAEITRLLDTAAEHGLNGAVVSLRLDTLCMKDAQFFERLERIKAACARNHLEMIPAIFSVGYGSSVLAHDRNLAAGLPVKDATFTAGASSARFTPDESIGLINGDFEDFSESKFAGYRLQDKPDVVSFVDTRVKHSGQASLRMEAFGSDPHGHGRIMSEIQVRPNSCYRVSVWVKTEGLQPAGAFKLQVLVDNRALAPQKFNLSPGSDWQKITMLFNSLQFDRVRLYAGVWRAESGKFWLDDWTLEEVGPLNVLHRPGTPVVVKSVDDRTTYVEGRDYARLEDPQFSTRRLNREAPSLTLLPDGRIREGDNLRVSWYHAMAINGSQVTVCMAEPALYEIFDHEAALLAEHVGPGRVFLNMDEIRMGGTCDACEGHNMGELLGECITRQVKILRRHMPGVEVYVWSDMLDPSHNARDEYYLVDGDYTGAWNHVPKDLTIAVWGREPRETSLRFFADRGFRTLAACYYDADDLEGVKGWIQAARRTGGIRGFMYTPWQKKYDLLPTFGELLQDKP